MTCDETRELLPDLLGGAPPPGVAGHLAACAACRAEAEELRALAERLRAAVAPTDAVTPPELDDVLAAARARATPRVFARRASQVAALLLAAVGGAGLDRAWCQRALPPPGRPPASASRAPELDPSVRAALIERPGGLAASLALLGALSERPEPGRR